MKRIVGGMIVAATLLVAADGTRATEKISLRVTPNVSTAPSTVMVRAMVERHPKNRFLHVSIDSGAFLRASTVQLDGERAPLLTEFALKNLPGGDYVVTAVLVDSQGHQTSVRRDVIIVPSVSGR